MHTVASLNFERCTKVFWKPVENFSCVCVACDMRLIGDASCGLLNVPMLEHVGFEDYLENKVEAALPLVLALRIGCRLCTDYCHLYVSDATFQLFDDLLASHLVIAVITNQ
jgi:hypothetical protein